MEAGRLDSAPTVKPSDAREAVALARAERGAAFLDKRHPFWWQHIKRTRLDMERGSYDESGTHGWDRCGCVLAQLYGDYDVGTKAFGLDPEGTTVVRLGFVTKYRGATTYTALTRAWKQMVRLRASRESGRATSTEVVA